MILLSGCIILCKHYREKGISLEDSHRVFTRRLELGLSVKTLSEKSGIAPGTIYRIERDGTTFHKVHVETALALAKALQAPLESLFRDEELSEVGRTPKTGVATKVSHYWENVVCMTCHLEIPLAYATICPDCTPQRESAAIAV